MTTPTMDSSQRRQQFELLDEPDENQAGGRQQQQNTNSISKKQTWLVLGGSAILQLPIWGKLLDNLYHDQLLKKHITNPPSQASQ